MKNSAGYKRLSLRYVALALTAVLTLSGALTTLAQGAAKVLPRKSSPYGKTYGEWSAAWWTWAMELPVDGHPFIDSPDFDVTTGQSGKVWFLGGPFGTVERTCTIPAGTALFIGLATAEASDLEGLGSTEAERRANAEWLADHATGVGCIIDGEPVADVSSYRTQSPEFSFTAPSPWLFGETGGEGTAVGDGYFVMLAPLSVGSHTIRITGTFVFSEAEGDPFTAEFPIDVTYHVTVK